MTRSSRRFLKLFLVVLPLLLAVTFMRQDTQAEIPTPHENNHHNLPEFYNAATDDDPFKVYQQKSAAIQQEMASVASALPQDVGQWSQVYTWPLVAVHAALMPTGKVLMYDAWEYGQSPSARLWDPNTLSFQSVPNYNSGLFCSANTMLSDGSMNTATRRAP